MKIIKSTKTLIAISIMGLAMSIASAASGRTIEGDGGASLTAEAVEAHKEATSDEAPLVEPGIIAHEAISDTIPATTEKPSATPPAEVAPSKPIDSAKEVYTALKGGEWLIAFGGILMLLVWGMRTAIAKMHPAWAKGELAGNVIAFGTAFSLAIGTALAAGEPISVGLMTAAAGAAWAAKGNWSHVQAAKSKQS